MQNEIPPENTTAAERAATRRWCFEKAIQLKADLDIAADLIFKAAEIEAYIYKGKNPRLDFQSSVDAAIAEVKHAAIAGVSEASKRKVLEKVEHWLKEYDAL